MNPSAPRRSFLSGASVLTLSALIVKVIGLLYRVPLLRVLGTEGMGYFNTAYELYALFCVIATAGLPVAMSVLISTKTETGSWLHADRIFRLSRVVFLVVGAVGTGLLWGLAGAFSSLLGNPKAAVCMRAIAPTVFLICLSSAHRGYFQGRAHMTPTAVSQVVEAGGKLILGLLFAFYARTTGCDLPMTAAWAVAGVSVGTGLSVVYLALHKRIYDRRCPPSGEGMPAGKVLSSLAVIAVPATLSAGVIGLAKCVDLSLILRRLQDVGYTVAEANAAYGCYSTLAVPVFGILPSLATSVSMSVVPALSTARGNGAGPSEVRKTATAALRVTLLFAIPASLGLAVFSEDILALLFAGQPDAVAEAAPWLSCLALSIPASCLVTVTGGMLQSAGRADRPLISMLVAVVCKTLVAYLLLGVEGIGMLGAPISSLLCDTVIVALNLVFLYRTAPDMLPAPLESVKLLCPLLPATISVAGIKYARHALGWLDITPLHTLGTILAVMCLYGAGALLLYMPRRSLPSIGDDEKKGT